MSITIVTQVCRNEKTLDIPLGGFRSVFKILYKEHSYSLTRETLVGLKLDVNSYKTAAAGPVAFIIALSKER